MNEPGWSNTARVRAIHREYQRRLNREREIRRGLREPIPYTLTPNAPWEPDPGDARMERRMLSRVHGGFTVWERMKSAPRTIPHFSVRQ